MLLFLLVADELVAAVCLVRASPFHGVDELLELDAAGIASAFATQSAECTQPQYVASQPHGAFRAPIENTKHARPHNNRLGSLRPLRLLLVNKGASSVEQKLRSGAKRPEIRSFAAL